MAKVGFLFSFVILSKSAKISFLQSYLKFKILLNSFKCWNLFVNSLHVLLLCGVFVILTKVIYFIFLVVFFFFFQHCTICYHPYIMLFSSCIHSFLNNTQIPDVLRYSFKKSAKIIRISNSRNIKTLHKLFNFVREIKFFKKFFSNFETVYEKLMFEICTFYC